MSSVSRRKFVKNSTSLLLGTSFLPIDVWGNKHSTPNNQMHLEVARVIKKKWGRKGLTLTLFYPKGSLGNIKPVVKKFIELTNVKIRLEEASLDQISSEMILKNRLSRKGGEFDIALPATFGLPDLVEARAIEDLTSYAREY